MRFLTSDSLFLVLFSTVFISHEAFPLSRAAPNIPRTGVCGAPWRVVFGTSRDDRIEAVVEDAAGDLIAVGYTRGTLGVENYWPVGDATGFVRKFDAAGMLLWEQTFDTADTDIVEAATIAPDGKIFVAGRTRGAFPGQSNGGQLDMFVAVLSSNGQLLDLLERGDERPQHPVAIAALGHDGLAIAGYDDVWVLGNAVMDWQNGFVSEFDVDTNGMLSERWSTRSDVIDWDVSTGVASARDGSGDIFVSRYNGSSPGAGGGLYVDRISPAGSIVWTAALSDFHLDYIVGVAVSDTNRVYAAGTTYLASVAGGEFLGGSDGFIAELNAETGDRKWAHPFGSTGSEWITSFSMDNRGDLLLAGTSDGIVEPGHIGVDYDPFAVIVSPMGDLIGAWQGTRAASSDDVYSVARACGDALAVAGSLSGIDPIANLGRTDAELTKVPFVRFDAILIDGFDPLI